MVQKYVIYKNNVLKTIYQKEKISRKELHDLLDIRFATITNIIKDFIKEGIIEERGKRKKNKAGRPHSLLRIVPNGKFFIGCELNPEKIISVILNFRGEIIGSNSIKIGNELKKEEILKEIKSVLKMLIEESKIEKEKIFGIGFVDPGIVDMEKGISLFSSIMPEWRNIPIKSYLEEHLSIQTFIIGTSQAKILSEKFFGKGKGCKNFIFIEYGEGVSCGVIIENRVIHGTGGVAGEFGHIKIINRNELCNCGKKGCLEAIVSIPAIIKKIKDITGENLNISEIVVKCEKENKIRKVVEEAFEIFGISVSNLVNLFNPETIILDKNFKIFEKFLNGFFEKIKLNMVYNYPVKFEISDFGEEIGAIGGGCLSLSKFLGLDI